MQTMALVRLCISEVLNVYSQSRALDTTLRYSFIDHPYVLDPAMKSEVLRAENSVQMRNEMQVCKDTPRHAKECRQPSVVLCLSGIAQLWHLLFGVICLHLFG